MPGEQTFGVEWRCPKCDSHALDLCPVGPLAPGPDTCLNCGGAFADAGDFARCAGCGMTRVGMLDFFGLDPAPPDPIGAAEMLFDLGLARRAIATLNHALVRDPANEPAWRIKYAFLSGLGFFNATLAVIEAAAEHAMNPDLLISRGHTLELLGRHSEAIGVFRQYLAAAPDGEYAGLALGNMASANRALGDLGHAEALFRQAIEKDPAGVTHYANYASLLMEQQRWGAALAALDEGLSRAVDDALAARLLESKSFAYAEQSRGVEALQAIDDAISRGTSGARTHVLRGRALGLLGRWPESLAQMRRALELEPKNAEALRALNSPSGNHDSTLSR